MAVSEWWRGAVVYQIYPRSFQDGNGDGVGDLPGIAARLDHVASLGVDAVWISPFFKSPMRDFGYDVADYRDVDPLFGTLEDFDRLLARAHALGLRVVIDLVLSHTSDQHAWFAESRRSRDNPKADWYVWADAKPDGTAPNNWLSVFGGTAWTWDTRRRQYYLHNFLVSQPDLNIQNPAVQDALLAEARFWLDRGVDGFRLDAANFYMHDPLLRDNPPRPTDQPFVGEGNVNNPYFWQRHVYDKSRPENLAFLGRLRALLDEYPDRMAVAEIGGDDNHITITAAYIAEGLLHTAYNFGFLGRQYTPAHLASILDEFAREAGRGWPSWAFSNHDVARVVSRWGGESERPDPGRARLFLMLLMALRGTVFLYQGEELGLPEADIPFERLQDPYGREFWPEYKGRDGCRTPMPWQAEAPGAGFSEKEPWLPIPAVHRELSVARQETDPDSVLAFARRLIRWRRSHPALVHGEMRLRHVDDALLVIDRSRAGTILAAFNLSDEAREYRPDLPEVRLAGIGSAASLRDGVLVLPPWSGAFLEAGG
jgi:alpha-glucosidase